MALNTRSEELKSTTAATWRDVGEDVAVAEDHALGCALGAAGEQDDGGGIGRAARARQAAGGAAVAKALQLGAEAEAGAQVLKPDEADAALHRRHRGAQLAAFDEGAGGQDDLDLRGGAGGEHAFGAGGEVQHGRDAAPGLQRHERDQGAHSHWAA